MGSKSDMSSQLAVPLICPTYKPRLAPQKDTQPQVSLDIDVIDMIDPDREMTEVSTGIRDGGLYSMQPEDDYVEDFFLIDGQEREEVDDLNNVFDIANVGGYFDRGEETVFIGNTAILNNGAENSEEKKIKEKSNSGKSHSKSKSGSKRVRYKPKRNNELWKCKMCDRTFTQRSSKARHEKLHLGVKPHKCHYCEKAFTRKYILDEHERIHTGERPHVCVICSKSFTVKACLRKHEAEHQGGAVHECGNCNGEGVIPGAELLRDGAQSDKSSPDQATYDKTSSSKSTPEKTEILRSIDSPLLTPPSEPESSATPKITSVQGIRVLSSQTGHKFSLNARRHKCYQCGKTFGSNRILQMHKRVHEADGRYRCKFCGKAFSMKTVLSEHENQHGVDEQTYQKMANKLLVPSSKINSKETDVVTTSVLSHFCKTSQPTYSLTPEMVSPSGQSHSSARSHTSMRSNSPASPSVRHNVFFTERVKKPYLCLLCNKAFRHSCRLAKHVRKHRREHALLQMLKTPVKDYINDPFIHPDAMLEEPSLELESVQKYESSYSEPNSPKPYVCNVCGVSFNHRTSWQIHKQSHAKDKKHHCSKCGVEFDSKSMLDDHEKTPCKNEALTGSSVRDDDESQEGKDYDHPTSAKVVTDKVTFNGAGLEVLNQSEKQDVFTCVYCSKTFSNFDALTKHQESCHDLKLYICPRCNLSFDNRSDLQNHAVIHAEEKQFKCETCKKSFILEEHYLKHLEHHQKDKRHKCQFCDKMFERNSYRLQHERIHTGERPYVCRFCSKTFAQRNSMQRHEIIHLGIKKYKCDICEKAFGRRESLQNHILTHTKGMKVKIMPKKKKVPTATLR